MIEPLYPGVFSATVESGLRVLVEEVPSSRSVSVGLWVKAGSRDDPESHPGLAHFLEHLLFKGTPSRDAVTISREIDALGGHLNGATGKEATFYYVDVPSSGLHPALEILADLVQHPAFDPKELERERGVVLEEIRGHDDDPEESAYDLFHAGLWQGVHPLSRPVLGEKGTIEEITRERLIGHYHRLYRPENMVLAACGAVKATELVDLADGLFSPSSLPAASLVRDRPRFQGGRHQYERRTAQTHIYIGLPGADAQDEDRFAHEVVNTVLGGGMSSRLFRLIREERGLAYAVSSSAMHYSDAGLWLIYAGVAPHNTEETIAIVLAQLDHLQREGITHDELALAKAKLRGNLILDLETNSNRMARLGSAAVTTREILSPDALIARLDAVTEEDAMRVIARFSQAERVNLAVIGPPEKGSTHKSSLVSSQSLR